MKFKTSETSILILNLLLILSPIVLMALPWSSILTSTITTVISSIVFFGIFLIPILGTRISIRYFRNHLKDIHIGQKALLFFPIINLLIISLITIAFFVN